MKNRPSKASLASVANYKFKANLATKTKHEAKPLNFATLICLVILNTLFVILSVTEYLFYIVILSFRKKAKYP